MNLCAKALSKIKACVTTESLITVITKIRSNGVFLINLKPNTEPEICWIDQRNKGEATRKPSGEVAHSCVRGSGRRRLNATGCQWDATCVVRWRRGRDGKTIRAGYAVISISRRRTMYAWRERDGCGLRVTSEPWSTQMSGGSVRTKLQHVWIGR